MGGIGKAILTGAKAAKGVVKGAVNSADKLAKLGVYGYVGTNLLEGKGVLDIGENVLLGSDGTKQVKEEGLAGVVNETMFGKNNADRSIIGNTVDFVGGRGTADKISQVGGQIVDGVHDAYHDARQAIPAAYHDARQAIADASNPQAAQQYPNDPFVQYNPYQQQAQGMYQQNAPVGPFQGVNSFVENMTGGKMGAMDAAGLMAAAYMMFGSRFGWMGKVASMLIGGYTVKDMQQRQQAMQMAARQYPTQQPQSQYVQTPQNNPNAANEEMAQEQVVTRMRR